MRTFFNFFTGTTGVILAIALCLVVTCVLCVASVVILPVAFPIATVTP